MLKFNVLCDLQIICDCLAIPSNLKENCKVFYHLAGVLILMELIGLLKYKSPDSKHNCQEVTMIKPIHALIWVQCKVFVFEKLLIAGFFIARAIM